MPKLKSTMLIRPGDTLYIEDLLPAPVFLNGLRGTYERPIVITRRSKVPVELPHDDPAHFANRIAYLRQEAGSYPVIGSEADQAALVLRDCQFVLLRDLHFEDCWPTAVYIDRSQNIGIVDCSFYGGTFAIGANGLETRDILVEGCSWQQTEEGEMWDRIPWEAIHGSYENASREVEPETDQRHYDGDFFRAWDIGGSVTIRGNHIRDAFNGIHFFNSTDALAPGVVSNTLRFNSGRRAATRVLIENNLFERIRDNCVEPEDHAWNWVVRNNSFADCYAPYSLELDRAGWLFIYNNHHWLLDLPGKANDGGRKGGSGFKSGGDQLNEGGIYVFNNSWLFLGRERLFRKGVIGRLRHYNNAIKVRGDSEGRLFGSKWNKPDDLDASPEEFAAAEEKRFTRRWKELRIAMDGDWIWDNNSIEDYRGAGYALGPGTRAEDPGFTEPVEGDPLPFLPPSRRMSEAGAAWRMQLPGYEPTQLAEKDERKRLGEQYEMEIPAGGPVGAGVPKEFLDRIDRRMTFLPDPPFKYCR